MSRLFIISIILLLAVGCEEAEPPTRSDVPFINVLSITPNVIREFTDSIVIELQYEDGNGDIGWVDADKYALTVHDIRLIEADDYYVPPLAPMDSEIPISGILKVKIKNTFLLGNGGDEKTYFELQITDRAGNKSNPSITDNVTIKKD